MKWKAIPEKYKISQEKLRAYGFFFKENIYLYQKKIDNFFYVVIEIRENIVFVRVYEQETKEEYLPFYVKNCNGKFVSKIREEVEELIEDILSRCFQNVSLVNAILEYAKEKYQVLPKHPWKNDPTSTTLTTKYENKWFGLIINIPYQKLGIDLEGNTNVLNLKNTPEKIKKIVDNKKLFSAYHMNKKHWLTIPLDHRITLEEIKKLLDESYWLVEDKENKKIN